MSYVPPPPYTPSTSLPTTPLPSYTTSPILAPLRPLTVSDRFKLTPTPTAAIPSAAPQVRLIEKALVASVAILGSWLADMLYIAALNFSGVLLTVLQLPVVVLLAWQPTPPETTGDRRPVGRAAAKHNDWVRRFTQIMWDWHDRLEEAELELPSRIQR